ncbi:sodium/glucose cotransporter 1-like [Octodon degus]|uniref:Sodium/glucose cotransporter 1-like n=1 Tax=Octodon degus TaxID=10160 RepID=A0A6P6EX44_OCTDE|nr:sodium/glucose cotransporter 1-like [Octodon degus]
MRLSENKDHTWSWSTMDVVTSNWKDILIVAVYLLLVLYIGLRALSRDRSTIKGFFLAGQNLVWGLIGGSLFAANIGSSHFIGLAGIGASSGIAIGAFEWNVSVQRSLAGKNKSHMRVGFIMYGYLKLLPMFLMVIPGMISRTFYPDQVACVVPSECEKYCGAQSSCYPVAYPRLVVSLLPIGLQGVMLSTVCAAIISSLTSAFNSISALFTMNIYAWMRPKASENELMITARFFIITLLATTIVWIPIIETSLSEKLFEHTLLIKSCLTPPITALFILAVFSRRINEEGAFWGLTFGIMIGLFRLLPELIYRHRTCEDEKCLMPLCSMHYLYFSMPLLLVSLLSMLGISFFRDPIPDKHLHRLCWSLRKSREERIDLDRDRTWKRLPRFQATPAMFGDSKSYFWEGFQLYFGLEPHMNSKVAPAKTTKETNATRKRKYSDSLEDAKVSSSRESSIKMEVSKEKVGQGDTLEGADILAQGQLSAKMKASTETMEDKKGSDMLDRPYWKKVISSSGTILITLVVLGHIYFA